MLHCKMLNFLLQFFARCGAHAVHALADRGRRLAMSDREIRQEPSTGSTQGTTGHAT